MSPVDIPARIRAYAEVVVDVDAGTAHRPTARSAVVGQRQRWDADVQQMVTEPVYGHVFRPRCYTPAGPEDPGPHIWQCSAGWAASHGIAGCADCWPPDDPRWQPLVPAGHTDKEI